MASKIMLLVVFFATLCSAEIVATNKVADNFLEVKGSRKGLISFVNNQKRLPEAEIIKVCNYLQETLKCNVGIGKTPETSVIVEIVDDPGKPTLAAYPEEFRATVNIAKLSVGLKGDAVNRFFASRCRKEILRGFCYSCGCGGSQFPNNIMAIKQIRDLDLCGEFIPGDTVAALFPRLQSVGVTPTAYVTYARACREGWAPAPANPKQQKIWDRIHQLPTKPIKILPETKPVKD